MGKVINTKIFFNKKTNQASITLPKKKIEFLQSGYPPKILRIEIANKILKIKGVKWEKKKKFLKSRKR